MVECDDTRCCLFGLDTQMVVQHDFLNNWNSSTDSDQVKEINKHAPTDWWRVFLVLSYLFLCDKEVVQDKAHSLL